MRATCRFRFSSHIMCIFSAYSYRRGRLLLFVYAQETRLAMNRKAAIFFLSLGLFSSVFPVAGCGGGGNDGGTSSGQSTITSVLVSCSPNSIYTGQTSACTSTVNGTGSVSSSVTWSVSPVSGGSVSSAGVFTPATVGTATITATSTEDSTKSGGATVTVTLAAPSNLVYPQTTISASVGQAITTEIGRASCRERV